MTSDAAPDQYASAESYLQRAVLLADLGRYDEAAAELGFAIALEPEHLPALTMLARVRLAADQPEPALAAAESAL
ncbi:MAG TPA: tetratricopeptide repeat protein, partial [Micromonospora sp.]